MEENVKFVTCKICGTKRRILTQHIAVKHGLSRQEYEEKYNSPVVCLERQLIQVERNKELNNKLSSDPYYIDLMKKVRSANCHLPQVIKARKEGDRRYKESEKGKIRNSEIMKNNHKFNDIQKKATEGKLRSKKFHDQKSEFMSNLLKELWKDESWKSNQLSKMFDGSKKKYTDMFDNTVYFRSSWELRLHNYLTIKGIDYQYEKIEISYISTDNKEHVYHPDFFIDSMNLILEVKPKIYTTNKINQIKRQVAIDAGFKFRFVTETELNDLNSFFYNL